MWFPQIELMMDIDILQSHLGDLEMVLSLIVETIMCPVLKRNNF